jgi:hypothetical protein
VVGFFVWVNYSLIFFCIFALINDIKNKTMKQPKKSKSKKSTSAPKKKSSSTSPYEGMFVKATGKSLSEAASEVITSTSKTNPFSAVYTKLSKNRR